MGQKASTPAAGRSKPTDGFFLLLAARTGDLDVLRLFLRKNPALAWSVSSDKSTPWHFAAKTGHLGALQLLAEVSKQAALSNTFNPISKAVNQGDASGCTPLMHACRAGHAACVELLLDLGASWSALDDSGLSALHHAAFSKHGGCVQLLLRRVGLWGESGPAAQANPQLLTFVNAVDARYGFTALHLAAYSGQVDGLRALLAVGAHAFTQTTADCIESHMPCNNGSTPLHMAAMMGHQNVAIELMAAYVKAVLGHAELPDPRQTVDAYANTPYKMATKRRHDAPLMLQVLDPSAVIHELQRGNRRRKARPDRGVSAPAADSPQEPAGSQQQPQGEQQSPSQPAVGSHGVERAPMAAEPAGVDGSPADISVDSGSSNGDADGGDDSCSQSEDEEEEEDDTPGPDNPAASPEVGEGQEKAPSPPTISIRRIQRLAAVYDTARQALIVGQANADGTPVPPTQALMQARLPQRAMGLSPASQTCAPSLISASVPAKASSVPPPSHSHKDLSEQPVPDAYVCPLTCRLYKDPVVAADGITYERKAIERHFASGSKVSPSTKKRLTSHELSPDVALLEAVNAWRSANQHPEDMS